jgi:D-3-phosphoglycerate dehydrogenase / 2-oxoglutarate reductase
MSTALAAARLNIADLLNKSKGDVAYTLIDTDEPVPEPVVGAIRAIPGVLGVRVL